MLTSEEKKTLKYYDKHAEEWSKDRSPLTSSFWDQDVEKFHHFLPKGKIIEIGSGSGREASRLIALKYDYIGTDLSKGLLGYAKKNNPKGKFLLKNVYDLDFPANFFDGFWTSATLLHIPKSKIEIALKSINRILKQGAVGFISIKENKGISESEEEKTG